MTDRLKGKVALVTGAGTKGDGIGNGKACAILYAREGAKVVATDIDIDAAQSTAEAIRHEGGECIAAKADVSLAADCSAMIEECVANFGRIDVLHNNVGITDSGGPVEYSEAQWDRMINVNAKSVFLTAKFALPHMERQKSGSVINISSINAVRNIPFPKFAYSASKAAMIAMSREIAIQYAPVGIRSNVILVGLIKSPIVEQNNVRLYGGDLEEMWKKRDAMCPSGHQGEVWDIANTSLFLASDESRYVNGVVLPVDGGLINLVKL
ncbi:MAG: SDR family oxidoreductase [Marinicaulis sp.]|nr:SDR family oxidoreductase [Marinicaulis sp.]NNE42303.1 SDR family oxidoreductase [Marinicaulis sp.]NNL89600.1 SDR family oxidoreductase [Marinicaulis sp.]